MSEIQVGTRVRIVPAGWADGGSNELPGYMARHVDGVVDSLNETTRTFRVAYEAKGSLCHETFKLPLIASDRIKILG